MQREIRVGREQRDGEQRFGLVRDVECFGDECEAGRELECERGAAAAEREIGMLMYL